MEEKIKSLVDELHRKGYETQRKVDDYSNELIISKDNFCVSIGISGILFLKEPIDYWIKFVDSQFGGLE